MVSDRDDTALQVSTALSSDLANVMVILVDGAVIQQQMNV